MATTRSAVTIDPRAYNLVKAAAIGSVVDAIVELVTNCDDAYQVATPGSVPAPFPIDIEVDYSGGVDDDVSGTLTVRDAATGMTGTHLCKAMTIIGQHLASADQRGFFSRGAKDVSVLGRVRFHTVKGGRYSSLSLFPDSTYEVHTLDTEATPAVRVATGLAGNGTTVVIDVLQRFGLKSPAYFEEDFHKVLPLRNIFSSPHHAVTLSLKHRPDGAPDSKVPVTYSFPVGDLLIDTVFEVPRYDDATVHFQLFRNMNLDKEVKDRKYMEHGFLVTSGIAIHDLLTFDSEFKHDPNLQYLFGSIHCDAINRLLESYAADGNDKSNPFLILNPNRIGGIQRKHPFITRVFDAVVPHIRRVLSLMALTRSSDTIDIVGMEEFASIARQLELTNMHLHKGNELRVVVDRPTGRFVRSADATASAPPESGRYVRVLRDFTHTLNTPPSADPPSPTDTPSTTDTPSPTDTPTLRSATLVRRGASRTRMVPTAATRGRYSDAAPSATSEYTLYQQVEDAVSAAEAIALSAKQRVDLLDPADVDPADVKDVVRIKENNVFEVVFRSDPGETYRFRITTTPTGIQVVINKANPVIAPLFQDSQEIDGIASSKALVLLNDILTEAFSRLLVSKDMRLDTNAHIFDGDDPETAMNKVFDLFDAKRGTIETMVFDVIQRLIAKRKAAKLKAAL
ncbi:MAG: hypothetical protein VX446_08325 [Bacteroidota bacterium]|nr:hypothetical protein [Bacteroidota bacterium]